MKHVSSLEACLPKGGGQGPRVPRWWAKDQWEQGPTNIVMRGVCDLCGRLGSGEECAVPGLVSLRGGERERRGGERGRRRRGRRRGRRNGERMRKRRGRGKTGKGKGEGAMERGKEEARREGGTEEAGREGGKEEARREGGKERGDRNGERRGERRAKDQPRSWQLLTSKLPHEKYCYG